MAKFGKNIGTNLGSRNQQSSKISCYSPFKQIFQVSVGTYALWLLDSKTGRIHTAHMGRIMLLERKFLFPFFPGARNCLHSNQPILRKLKTRKVNLFLQKRETCSARKRYCIPVGTVPTILPSPTELFQVAAEGMMKILPEDWKQNKQVGQQCIFVVVKGQLRELGKIS